MEWTEDTGSLPNEALSRSGLVCSGLQPRDSQRPTVVLPGKLQAVWTSAEESLGGQGGERTDSTGAPAMVVTQLSLEFRFQGKKLRGFSCELTRSPHGVLPESVLTTTCQVAIPILLSGLGMMTAGLVMNTVQVRTGLQGRGNRQGGGQEPGCSLGVAGPSWGLAAAVLVRRYLGLPAP